MRRCGFKGKFLDATLQENFRQIVEICFHFRSFFKTFFMIPREKPQVDRITSGAETRLRFLLENIRYCASPANGVLVWTNWSNACISLSFVLFVQCFDAPIQHDPPPRQERIRSSLGPASNKILPRAHREYYPISAMEQHPNPEIVISRKHDVKFD